MDTNNSDPDVAATVSDDGEVLVRGALGKIALRTRGPDGTGLVIYGREMARAIAHAILDADRHPTGDRELKAKGL